jgi:putative phosphoribosyl transferase
MQFQDRIDAARQLARALDTWRGQRPLVLAIPRGAVPMGVEIARALDGELDVVLVRKLRAPFSPEFAVGAIDETGWVYLTPHAADAGADTAWLAGEQAVQRETLKKRRSAYTPACAPVDPAGRIVILVDDGLATGATMIAALHAVRAHRPARLICAVPVASPEGLAAVRPWADEVICLETPRFFDAVGRFYKHFPQVTDAEVLRSLRADRPVDSGSSGSDTRETGGREPPER